jgi:hypothetical protein
MHQVGERHMRILFCGDIIRAAFDRLNPTVVIEGEARGADQLCRKEAVLRGIEVLRFPAQWERYGRGAGPIRNQQMLDEGQPDMVVAFHPDLARSKGTADMVKRAEAAGIPCEVIR